MNESTTPIMSPTDAIKKQLPLTQSLTRYLNTRCSESVLKQLSLEVEDSSQQVKTHIFFDQEHHRPTSARSYPIVYQRKRIGALNLLKHADLPGTSPSELTNLSDQIGILVKRNAIQTLSHQYLGKSASLQGYSDQILNLEKTIERIAAKLCPVFIQAESGSEVIDVACSIHFSSYAKHHPFYEIDCASCDEEDFAKKLHHINTSMNQGCIFFSHIDALSISQQKYLLEQLTTQSNNATSYTSKIDLQRVRVISSSEQNIQTMVDSDQFLPSLWHKLNFFNLNIPPLRERPEDIQVMVEQLSELYQLSPEQHLTEQAKLMLKNYRWPNNVAELEKVLLRAFTLAQENNIGEQTLASIYPQLAATTDYSLSNKQCVDHLLAGNLTPFQKYHPSLQKALSFIMQNWQRDISLKELSANAFVSPSHLSYLFKRALQRSFKQILAELRIRKACELIEHNPNLRITDLCMEVGFGDLSHFEKIFRRYTNMSPREYKKKYQP
ncbi:AraC family transcriptional regulator [Pseudoalteromonas luteoviolacea]|uniref:AraC family transcriptional regulator n=1 Tax=Pseudoalteromonas luteoviolacea TaxID=43657 RepID=UPI001B3680E4|nr:AraC family transcriptional regulator [Pseudoalteromonas luteoviolacea]MBQ4839303.1 helix-turn-helix domain-containing protein [Pseudoalteromonas luteoviolacea]